MTVKAQISEADVIKVRPGQGAYFTILGDPNHKYYGALHSVAPAPDSIATDTAATQATSTQGAAVYYSGLFDVANSDGRLRPSMTAQVSFVLASAKHVLIAPAAALKPPGKDGLPTVEVLDPKTKKTALHKVRTGINNNVDVQILSGLKVGEQVVTGQSAGAFQAPKPPGDGG
jgi:macrolide-specific efflux system membrane fusion protein